LNAFIMSLKSMGKIRVNCGGKGSWSRDFLPELRLGLNTAYTGAQVTPINNGAFPCGRTTKRTMPATMNLHSRRKLKPRDAARFANAEPILFAELAKVVCSAGVIPEKELHECWQMAESVHKVFPESLRVADLAAGHGLLAWILVLLARAGDVPLLRTAVAVDIKRPISADALAAAMTSRWPELTDVVHYVEGSIDAVFAEDGPRTLMVAAHACGSLSDRVLMAAIKSQCPVAIMPCCHSLRNQGQTLEALALASDLPTQAIEAIGPSAVSVGLPAAIDQFRIDVLTALAYEISEDFVQQEITKFHRIIMGRPDETRSRGPGRAVSSSPARSKRSGEVRAYEKVQAINLAQIMEAQRLSKLPSREWLRSFDLSFWVDDESIGHNMAATLHALMPIDLTIETQITLVDQYADPKIPRLAFTYRIDMSSSQVSITKSAALMLRSQLCLALHELSRCREAGFVLR
jgi:hypothetical protein